MKLYQAKNIAEQLQAELAPHCKRIEIAGSIRRQKPEVGDIELVCIPKAPVTVGLFEDDFAKWVNQYEKVKGEPNGKYTQRIIPFGHTCIKLDLFMVTEETWAYQLLVRTGSARFSEWVAGIWKKRGYVGKDGVLYDPSNKPVKLRDELELLKLFKIPELYYDPRNRDFLG